jgi:hypothetical protein
MDSCGRVGSWLVTRRDPRNGKGCTSNCSAARPKCTSSAVPLDREPRTMRKSRQAKQLRCRQQLDQPFRARVPGESGQQFVRRAVEITKQRTWSITRVALQSRGDPFRFRCAGPLRQSSRERLRPTTGYTANHAHRTRRCATAAVGHHAKRASDGDFPASPFKIAMLAWLSTSQTGEDRRNIQDPRNGARLMDK